MRYQPIDAAMRPAELLALAATAARTAPAPTKSSAGDADAFAKALGSQVDSSRTDPAAGDGHCGTAPAAATQTSDTGEAATNTPVRPRGFLHDRPDRAVIGEGLPGGRDPAIAEARSDWRDFIRSLRDMGVLAGPGGAKAADETAKTSGTSTPKTTADGVTDTTTGDASPFGQALDALGAAISAALADPAANAAPEGQLPPAVQAALDAAVAAAPAPLQARIGAFAERLTMRLAAAMTGETGQAGDTAQAASNDAARTAVTGAGSASPTVQAIMAALNGSGDGTALSILNDLKAKGGSLADQLRADAKASTTARPAATDTTDTGRVARPADPVVAATLAKTADATPAAQPATTDALTAQAGADTDAAPTTARTPETSAAAPTTAAAQTAEVHAAATLAAARGAPELVAQMAAVISRKLEGRVTRFNMELNPAEMGRVDVKLSIEADGRIAAQMSFDNPVAAADMRGKADELRRQLELSGFNVASEDLTFTDRQPGQQFAGNERDQAAATDAARGRAFREAERTARLAEDAGRLSNRAVLGLDMRV